MLLTISYAGPRATELGFLLYKHPARVQSFDLAVGTAHVFYPEASDDRCTAALLLEVDPIGLVRSHRFGGSDAAGLDHYVNDRPYASSSMLAVAIGQVFRTAMTGRSDSFPDLAANPIDLELALIAVPSRGTPGLASALFSPLGWEVTETVEPLDPERPEWGPSDYANLVLRGRLRLADALRQVYVLLPVLDDSKHYWVSDDEVAKLLRAGEGWLAEHPSRDLITRRYLAHQRSMVDDATARLTGLDDTPVPDAAARVTPLSRLRADAVLDALVETGAASVADLGCGEGALLAALAADRRFTRIIGADVSARALSRAEDRLHLRELGDAQRDRITLLQSSATYLDDRIRGLDALVLMEVIEHVDPDRLGAVEASVFAHAHPAVVVVTTPNAEYNPLYPNLPAGALRHADHRFEWTRAEFAAWADGVAARAGYTVEYRDVGDPDGRLGAPTQLALFRRS